MKGNLNLFFLTEGDHAVVHKPVVAINIMGRKIRMDGDLAKMDEICALADKYDALVMTDECHSAGFIGKTGRGVPEHYGVQDRVDIITGTLGKALGGAMGGYTTGPKEIIDMLRQKSRPYLFSNSLAPSIVGASIKVFDLLSSTTELRDRLEDNTKYFKEKIIAAGFDIKPAYWLNNTKEGKLRCHIVILRKL